MTPHEMACLILNVLRQELRRCPGACAISAGGPLGAGFESYEVKPFIIRAGSQVVGALPFFVNVPTRR